MARPRANINLERFKELYHVGYTDLQIALKLGISRVTILRQRQELGYPPNREVGERGISVNENEAYWLLIRRSLPHIGKFLQQAAREYYQKTSDWERYFIAMVMEPKEMFHPIPGPYAGDPEKMNFKNTKYITDFEKGLSNVGLAGVPGPTVIELIRVYKSADQETCKQLARKAVEEAGYVRTDTLVKDVEKCITPEELQAHWEEQEREAFDWTPVQDWGRQRETIYRDYNTYYSAGSGQVGSTGSINSISNTQAFLGAKGY